MSSEKTERLEFETAEYIKCLKTEKIAIEQKDLALLSEVIKKKQIIIQTMEALKKELNDDSIFSSAIEPLRCFVKCQDENISFLETTMENLRLELLSLDDQSKRLAAYKKMIESG